MEDNLKVVRMHRLEGDSKVKAFADISIGDFVVKGCRANARRYLNPKTWAQPIDGR